MRTRSKVGLAGLCATLLVGGLTLILTAASVPAKVAGVVLIAATFFVPVVLWLQTAFLAERIAVNSSMTRAATQMDAYTKTLDDTARRLGIRNDARFVPDGFIGLQRQCLVLDEDSRTGQDSVRMAILGHLPSYMRLNELSDERGHLLYDNWEPPHLVGDYVRLVNRRSAALKRFVETGGIVREIYDKAKLTQYVGHGSTFHDKVRDPREEIVERLRALIHYLALPNYYICLVGEDEARPGPHFLLKQGVGLVLDLRTTETQKHFTKSLDGLHTESPSILTGFEEKFSLTWRKAEKDTVRAFLENLLRHAQAGTNPGA